MEALLSETRKTARSSLKDEKTEVDTRMFVCPDLSGWAILVTIVTLFSGPVELCKTVCLSQTSHLMPSVNQLLSEWVVEGQIGRTADRNVHQYSLSFTPAGDLED